MEAILSIFAYYSHKKDDERWNKLKIKALLLLQSIFDLEKSYRLSYPQQQIVATFIGDVLSSGILPFAARIDDYNKSKSSLEEELEVIKYLENLSQNCKNNELIEEQLQKKCGWELENKPEFVEKIGSVLEKFLINYAGTDKLKYDDDNFDPIIQTNLLSLMISCWFLQLMGNKFTKLLK